MVFPPEQIHFSPKLAAGGVFAQEGAGLRWNPSAWNPSAPQVRNSCSVNAHQVLAVINMHFRRQWGVGFCCFIVFLFFSGAHFYEDLSQPPLTANKTSGVPLLQPSSYVPNGDQKQQGGGAADCGWRVNRLNGSGPLFFFLCKSHWGNLNPAHKGNGLCQK